jgi:hypothetical protein
MKKIINRMIKIMMAAMIYEISLGAITGLVIGLIIIWIRGCDGN